jgi:putative zinc finger/helix-turn-helix YgiT family protein
MNTNEAILCPTCDKGYLKTQVVDYPVTLPDGIRIIVPEVSVDVCDKCGEIALSLNSSRKIDAYIARETEVLSRAQLISIRNLLAVDQTEMSEILGLGTKTYHRWENGSQYPSRSMCYYIRLLAAFPEAFAWLRERRWRGGSHLPPPVAPDPDRIFGLIDHFLYSGPEQKKQRFIERLLQLLLSHWWRLVGVSRTWPSPRTGGFLVAEIVREKTDLLAHSAIVSTRAFAGEQAMEFARQGQSGTYWRDFSFRTRICSAPDRSREAFRLLMEMNK